MVYHKLPPVEELRTMYFDNLQPITEIANHFGSSPNAVSLKLRRAGDNLRSLSEAQRLNSNHILLTTELLERLDGLLLGDGCISPAKSKHSACYTHTDKHLEYLEWLAKELKEHEVEILSIRRHPTQDCYNLTTKYYVEFMEVRNKWYPNGIKKLPMDFVISPCKLFDFYIGDGNLRNGKNGTKKGESVRLAMYFDNEGRKRMINELNKIGINATENGEQIYIRANSKDKFFKYISVKSSPLCYTYKFPKGVII